jgi:hypothetical protein
VYFLLIWGALGAALYLEFVAPLEKTRARNRELDAINDQLGEQVAELEERADVLARTITGEEAEEKRPPAKKART